MFVQEQSRQRHLEWEGCYNIRDLGGLPTEDGRQTRWGAIVRADYLGRLTWSGRQALLNYGVRTIIDLRKPEEVAEEPSAVFEDNGRAPTYLNVNQGKFDSLVQALIDRAETRAQAYNVILDYNLEATAAVMRAIAWAGPGGVIIHCQAGKDRTGINVALLLRLAGVPTEIVAADYAQSQERLWPLYEKIVAAAGGEEKVEFWLKPTVTAETMEAVLAHLETSYGSVAEYLLRTGLSRSEIERLVGRLLA